MVLFKIGNNEIVEGGFGFVIGLNIEDMLI